MDASIGLLDAALSGTQFESVSKAHAITEERESDGNMA